MTLDRWNQHRQGRLGRARVAAIEGIRPPEDYGLDTSDVLILRLAQKGHCGKCFDFPSIIEAATDLGAVKVDSTFGWLLKIEFLRVAVDGVSLTERGQKALRLYEAEMRELDVQPRE